MRDDVYADRAEAGRVLADALGDLAGREPLVLALPRGGVPVAFEIARRLDAPLDVMVVRKLGVPGHLELAMGAVATGGIRVLNREVLEAHGVTRDVLEEVTARELEELHRREVHYRGARPLPDIPGKTVILVDDGLATGATMRAAISAVRARDPAEVVVAVPVAPADTVRALEGDADEVVCPRTPPLFYGLSRFYEDFGPVPDEEVRALLERARPPSPPNEELDGIYAGP